MIDEAVAEKMSLEKTEVVKPEETDIVSRLTSLAAQHLAEKMASAWQPDSIHDKLMRYKGAELQGQLTRFIVENYDSSTPLNSQRSRLMIAQELSVFQENYRRLVIQPLASRGINIDRLPPTTGMSMVLDLMSGVRGTVAAYLMAKESGWQVSFPTPEQDVKEATDLILEKNGQPVKLQVKCRQEGKMSLRKANESGLFWLTVPAPTPGENRFYLDQELGIPHTSEAAKFNLWLINNLN